MSSRCNVLIFSVRRRFTKSKIAPIILLLKFRSPHFWPFFKAIRGFDINGPETEGLPALRRLRQCTSPLSPQIRLRLTAKAACFGLYARRLTSTDHTPPPPPPPHSPLSRWDGLNLAELHFYHYYRLQHIAIAHFQMTWNGSIESCLWHYSASH